jgi:S1-C subfamily serine protease
MSINNNILEIAEAYLSGSLSEAEVSDLKHRLHTDSAFAAEFNESANLISSFKGSGRQKRFRAMLRDIHEKQAAGANSKKSGRISLPAHFWRTASVAATVAILSSAFTIWSLKPSIKKTDSQYSTISREVEHIKKVQAGQQAEQKQLRDIISKNTKPAPPPSDVKYTGTGFAITNDGYFVTAYHVLHDGKSDFDSVYIQNHEGQYFKATLINFSPESDIAILKVEKKNFRFGKGELPYTFAAAKAGLGTHIFTLGYPGDDMVYDEGYISSKNGYEDNDMQYTLHLPAGHGQSGSPVVDEKGNMLGLLTAVGSQGEANTYAVSSKALISLIHSATNNTIHLPKVNRLGRMKHDEQIEKMEAYTFSVKVYKK